MPTYLVHGFRWPRSAIRIFIAMHNLDDAAAEWIILPGSGVTLLNTMYTQCDWLPPCRQPIDFSGVQSPSGAAVPTPSARRSSVGARKGSGSFGTGSVELGIGFGQGGFNSWSPVKFVEQYDCLDETVVSQPFAYVADELIEVRLGCDIAAEMAKYEASGGVNRGCSVSGSGGARRERQESVDAGAKMQEGNVEDFQILPPKVKEKDKDRYKGWFDRLRAFLAPEAEMGWYVVVCDELDRFAGDDFMDEDDEEEDWDKEEQEEDVDRERGESGKEKSSRSGFRGLWGSISGREG